MRGKTQGRGNYLIEQLDWQAAEKSVKNRMKTYSHLPCCLLSIIVGVGWSTVVSCIQIQSVDWDITVDVMSGNSLIEKTHNEVPKKN